MEIEQITIREIYLKLKNLEKILQKKGIISKSELFNKDDEAVWDWPTNIQFLADEDLLKEDWLSQEDEEAWKNL